MDDVRQRLCDYRLCVCQVVGDAVNLRFRNGHKLGITTCSTIHSQQTPIGAKILRTAQTSCTATAADQWIDDDALSILPAPYKFVTKNHRRNATAAVPQESRNV